jgi:hypothetical protein
VPVTGPWVVVPTGTATGQLVEFQMSCPRGYIVGGLDAELSSPFIDVSFAGTMGSPVNPGITTSTAAVFSARYVGLSTPDAATVRPHVGCIPASGGGGRTPTAASPVFRPGRPTLRRVRDVAVRPGAASVTQGCAKGERLVAASHAVAFITQTPPIAAVTRSVRTKQVVRNNRITVSIQAVRIATAAIPLVQVGAVCAGAK